MTYVNPEKTGGAILNRAISQQAGDWSLAAAQSLIRIRLADEDLARADELARKAIEGNLSESEAQELEEYRHAGRLLEMLKAKAKISLKEAGAA